MALTTRAAVLQRLGLTDDATNESAFSITYTGANVATAQVTAGDRFILTDNMVEVLNVDLTSTSYDTLTELIAAIDGVTNFAATLDPDVSGSFGTTLLDTMSVTTLPQNNPHYFTYTNDASGTVSALIDRLILEVDAKIGRFCGRIDDDGNQTFESASRTEVYDGTGSSTLTLRNTPVTAITSVSLIDDSGNSTTVASTDYRRDARTGVLHRLKGTDYGWPDDYVYGVGPRYRQRTGPVWCRGFQNYSIVYTGGYATVPSDLQSVATTLVCDAFLERRESGGVQQHQTSSITRQFKTEADRAAYMQRMLGPYKRPGAVFA